MIKSVKEALNDYMFRFIETVCNEIGPRESGEKEEIDTGNRIEEELKNYCDKAYQEEYTSSPHAFLGFIRYAALLIVISIGLYWTSLFVDMGVLRIDRAFSTGSLIIALALMLFAVSYLVIEVMKYYEYLDFLFPKRASRNVIGTIDPSGEVKNTVIFSGHHDSAYEFNLFYYLRGFGQATMNMGYAAVAIILVVTIVKLVFQLLSVDPTRVFFWFGIAFLFFLPIVGMYIFFHSYKPVLGAYDNLSGVAALLGIGRYLSENRKNSAIFPKNTRVILISFAGEEAGLRGSKRYVQAHYSELKESGAHVVNIDSIAKRGVAYIINREPGIGTKHDPIVYESLFKIAGELNLNTRLLPLAFGATDAAVFSLKGIPAATISDLDLKRFIPYYHTRDDTPDVIEKEVLGQVVEICLEYLRLIDMAR